MIIFLFKFFENKEDGIFGGRDLAFSLACFLQGPPTEGKRDKEATCNFLNIYNEYFVRYGFSVT